MPTVRAPAPAPARPVVPPPAGRWVVPTSDGLSLHARLWTPSHPVAVVCLIHGFGEHVARYAHVARALEAAGVAVFGFDQRGHGRSPGPRGYTPSYRQLLEDIDAAVRRAREWVPGVPSFLWAHSMGGGEALNYLLRGFDGVEALHGAVVTSPWLDLRAPPTPVLDGVARLFARAWPTYQLAMAHHAGQLSHDPTVDAAYFSDPYVHAKITAPLYVGVSEAGAWARAHAGRLDRPVLLMHGTADPITCPRASAEFAATAPAGTCTFVPWEGLYHELHNEFEGPEVVATATDWIRAQLETDERSTACAVTR